MSSPSRDDSADLRNVYSDLAVALGSAHHQATLGDCSPDQLVAVRIHPGCQSATALVTICLGDLRADRRAGVVRGGGGIRGGPRADRRRASRGTRVRPGDRDGAAAGVAGGRPGTRCAVGDRPRTTGDRGC